MPKLRRRGRTAAQPSDAARAREAAGALRAKVLDDYLRAADFSVAAADAAAALMGVSRSQLYRVLARYSAAATLETATPRVSDGGRGKGRLDPVVEAAAQLALTDCFFVPPGESAARTHKKLIGALRHPEVTKPGGVAAAMAAIREGRAPGPPPPGSAPEPVPIALRTLRRRAAARPESDFLIRNHGITEAKRLIAPILGKTPTTFAPLERVQLDHARLDVLLRADLYGSTPLTAWITALIDEYCRGLLGWYIGFEEPSALTVALAIQHALTDKRPAAHALDPRFRNPLIGIPRTLLHDRAKEFDTVGFRLGCKLAGIELLDSTPGYMPHLRGMIERFNNTCANLAKSLPGAKGANTKEAAAARDHHEPTLRIEHVRQLFEIFIAGDYNLQPVGDNPPPAVVFEGAMGALVAPFRSWSDQRRHDFFVSFLPHKDPTLGRHGLKWDLTYWDPKLASTYAREGGIEISCRRDPRHRHVLYVPKDEAGRTFRTVPATGGIDTPEKADHEIAALKAGRSAAKRGADPDAAYRAAAMILGVSADAEAEKKGAAQISRAAKRAEKKRLAAADSPPPTPAPKPAQEEEAQSFGRVLKFDQTKRSSRWSPDTW